MDTTGTSAPATEDNCITDSSENVEGTCDHDFIESRMLTNS